MNMRGALFGFVALAALTDIPAQERSAAAPWTVKVTPTLNPLPVGLCAAVHLTVLDAAGREPPRNPQGTSHHDRRFRYERGLAGRSRRGPADRPEPLVGVRMSRRTARHAGHHYRDVSCEVTRRESARPGCQVSEHRDVCRGRCKGHGESARVRRGDCRKVAFIAFRCRASNGLRRKQRRLPRPVIRSRGLLHPR